MKTKKILISITFTGILFLLLVSFVKAPKNDYVIVQQKKWVAPASADKIVNPLKGDANAAASGKKLYKVLCFVCHGPKGKGDGMENHRRQSTYGILQNFYTREKTLGNC